MPRVADVMTAPPIVVRSDAPIGDASILLARYAVAGLPVVDPTGALVGVISEVDLMRLETVPNLRTNRRALLVRHLMTAPAVSVLASTPVDSARRRMERHHVRRLVVVADDDELRPIGVVSAGDLARALDGPSPKGARDHA